MVCQGFFEKNGKKFAFLPIFFTLTEAKEGPAPAPGQGAGFAGAGNACRRVQGGSLRLPPKNVIATVPVPCGL